MSLYLFPLDEDPGPELRGAAASGLDTDPDWPTAAARTARCQRRCCRSPHGTTIVALRYDGGVIMAGDRRATEGAAIAHRGIEKVFPADRYSAVAIAGAAGPAIEMVRLFQTQLEHYEKVEGTALSLEGKANQLSQMIRAQPADGDAGPRGRAALRRLGPAPRRRTDLHLRRDRRPLRRDRLPRDGLGWPGREDDDQARLPGGPDSRRGGRARRRGAVPGGRRGRRDRWSRPAAWHLPDRRDGRRDGFTELADEEVAERFARRARPARAGATRGATRS